MKRKALLLELVGLFLVVLMVTLLGACSQQATPTPSASASATAPATSAKPTPATSATAPSASATAPATSAAAGKVFNLKYGSHFTQQSEHGIQDTRWMQKIEQETGGRVKFTAYWAASLLNPTESIKEIRNGVADVGIGVPGLGPGWPVYQAMGNLFYGTPSTDKAWKVFKQVWADFPEIRAEYPDLKLLGINVNPGYDLLTSKKPVRAATDFNGLTIYSKFEAIKDLGANPVNIGINELYLAMQKGTVDGGFMGLSPLLSYRLAEVTKYYTYTNIFVSPTWGLLMNLNTWNSLPPDIQKIFDANIDWWTQTGFEEVDKGCQLGYDLGVKQGVEFIKLPAAEQDKINAAFEKYSLQSIANLDKQGLPGTAIFKEIRSLISAP
jgi:TRAP-type C4-dicarboxylate transport system substrate-binding protein